jgi:xanthine dehydrogenase accessory factor
MFEALYKTLVTQMHDGQESVLLSTLSFGSPKSGMITDKKLLTRELLKGYAESDAPLYETACLALDTGKLQLLDDKISESLLIEPFIPNPRLLVFGGGHIAVPLADYAARVGFDVTVIDDRPSFANTMRFPQAEKVICESFENSFHLIDLRPSDFVVIITRGHRYDGIVLREILNHTCHYVGMIGSKRRVQGMMEELLTEGFLRHQLDKVHSPIGLDIGAITPDEIAISIVSELIACKNKPKISQLGKSFSFPEFDKTVALRVSEYSEVPKALITILSSKGSVPRKAGAKMIAYLDGRTVGSIGGGCSESEVLLKARRVMLDKGFLIEHVDMTGDVAESEGMVCGGTMEVLIESF